MIKKNTMRKQIQLQSLSLFVKYGYNGVTMDQIADAVGISKSTIYYSHFTGKLELIKSIIVDEMKYFQDSMQRLSEADILEPSDIGRNMINNWITNIKENRLFWKMLFGSLGEPQISEIIKTKYNEIYSQIRDVTALLYTHSGTANPNKRATLLLATLDGLMYQSLFYNHLTNFEEIIEYLIEIYKV